MAIHCALKDRCLTPINMALTSTLTLASTLEHHRRCSVILELDWHWGLQSKLIAANGAELWSDRAYVFMEPTMLAEGQLFANRSIAASQPMFLSHVDCETNDVSSDPLSIQTSRY